MYRNICFTILTFFVSSQAFAMSEPDFISNCLQLASGSQAPINALSCTAQNPVEQAAVSALGINLDRIDISTAKAGTTGEYFKEVSLNVGKLFRTKVIRIGCQQSFKNPDILQLPAQDSILLQVSHLIDSHSGYYLKCKGAE